MSDTMTKHGAALATAGLAAAAVLAARSAQAQSANTTPVTLYFAASPGQGAVQIPSTSPNGQSGPNIKVLNFALALETLEAELYRQALARLTGGGADNFGNNIAGLNVGSSEMDAAFTREFGAVEADHRDFYTRVLGGNYVLNLGLKFDFKINTLDRAGVTALLYAAELTGVSAYLGAVTQFADKTFLNAAAAILGTEARHTAALAAVQNALFSKRIETAPLANENGGRDVPLMPDQVLNTGATVPGGRINPVSGPSGFVVKSSGPPPP